MIKAINKLARLSLVLLISLGVAAQESDLNKTGWEIGVQSYTFHKFSFQEAVGKVNQLGLNSIEVYFGQPLGQGMEGAMDFNMIKKTQQQVLDYAKSKDVKIVACGVVVCNDEAEWKQLFEFAHQMQIGLITCEPEYKHLKYVDQLANEYGIDVAIHNHPKPSNYWNPDLFLKAVEGLSDRIGACADVGHWRRMGIDPLEGLKKYEGRMKSLHFKDIKEKMNGESEQHDVIWGTGMLDMKGMLVELKRQGFKGLFSIEYEYNWDDSVPDIRKSLQYFHQVAGEIFD